MNSFILDTYLHESVKDDIEDCDIIAKDWCVYEHERLIDLDESLYLFTWSPDSKELPDCDFNTQHCHCISTIANFLKTVRIGLACVESTQMGVPHYHGWYQLSKFNDLPRITMVKVLQRLGNLKITKSKGHIKIHSYIKAANCLYYYKKELLDQSVLIDSNPITKDMVCPINFNDFRYLFVKEGQRQSVEAVEAAVNLT